MKEKLFVHYGSNPFENTVALLEHLDLFSDIPSDSLIGIKPNLEFSKPSKSGATTDPGVVEGIVHYLKLKGLDNIIILDGSSDSDFTDLAFQVCGYKKIAKKYGVKLVDLQKDSSIPVRTGNRTLFICNDALAVDYLINVPVLKADSRIGINASLANMFGCVPNSEKKRFKSDPHIPVSCINSILKSDLIIVDSIIGDLKYEEGGAPVNMNRIIAGKDPVLTDSYCASLIGIKASDVDYIMESEKKGVGFSNIDDAEIIEINRNMDTASGSKQLEKLLFSDFVVEKDACAGCHAGLVHALSRLEDKDMMSSVDSKIYIGKYFRNKRSKTTGIGIGDCCRNFDRYVKGCPPRAIDILDFICAKDPVVQ